MGRFVIEPANFTVLLSKHTVTDSLMPQSTMQGRVKKTIIRKRHLLICWIATPRKTHCLLANNRPIQLLQSLLSIVPVETQEVTST